MVNPSKPSTEQPPAIPKKTNYRFSLSSPCVSWCFNITLDGGPDKLKAVAEVRKIFNENSFAKVYMSLTEGCPQLTQVTLYVEPENITTDNIINMNNVET